MPTPAGEKCHGVSREEGECPPPLGPTTTFPNRKLPRNLWFRGSFFVGVGQAEPFPRRRASAQPREDEGPHQGQVVPVEHQGDSEKSKRRTGSGGTGRWENPAGRTP